ncbi:F196B protein, partial [Ardeotis kori]|nr:F196B protein [Ardeotis kori]
MVSREPLPGPGPAGEGGQEKAMTVRSVLLNRDSPDVESRLKRRRNRTQQVRFKDLVEGGAGQGSGRSPPNTPRASPPPRDAPEPAALCASRRSWAQAPPGSLTLPLPRRGCMSTAIQTSPSLQKPFPAPQPRSTSVCDV